MHKLGTISAHLMTVILAKTKNASTDPNGVSQFVGIARYGRGNRMGEFIVREIGYPGAVMQEVIGELIRCKDCRWWDVSPSSTSAPAFHRCRGFEKHHTKADEFCSRAERREDEE